MPLKFLINIFRSPVGIVGPILQWPLGKACMLSRAEDRTRHTNCYKTVNYIKQKPRDAPNKPMEFQINFDVKSQED